MFWGFAAILGDLIQLSWYMITLWRVLLASISLMILIRLGSIKWNVKQKDVFAYSMIGIVIAGHWLTFFGSIKFANASVALVTFASVSFMISILEPLLIKSKFSYIELGLGILIIPAMALIVNTLDTSMHTGFYLGIVSAFLAVLFGVMNKKLISNADPLVITCIEMIAATIFLLVCLPVWLHFVPHDILIPMRNDWYYLAALVLGCTTYAFYVSVRSLRYLTVFSQSMVMNLEPVYGIFFAVIILGENRELGYHFYVGVCVILLTVFLHPILKRKLSEVPS